MKRNKSTSSQISLENMFQNDSQPEILNITPREITTSFSEEQIEKVATSLKNHKSPVCDSLNAAR